MKQSVKIQRFHSHFLSLTQERGLNCVLLLFQSCHAAKCHFLGRKKTKLKFLLKTGVYEKKKAEVAPKTAKKSVKTAEKISKRCFERPTILKCIWVPITFPLEQLPDAWFDEFAKKWSDGKKSQFDDKS